MNKELALDVEGNEVICEDYGLQWNSRLTEDDGRFIAKRELACSGEGPLTTKYFDIACHFLADPLGEACANDVGLRRKVNEMYGEDTSLFYGSQVGEAKVIGINSNCPNFLSQFYVSSMGVIIANFAEVRIENNNFI